MPLALPPFDPVVEMVVSSRGMSKGVEQADEPQVIPEAYLQIGDVQIGGQWKNVTSTTADGEGAAFLNATRKFGAYSVTLGAAYKFQTGTTQSTDSGSFEFAGSLGRKIGGVSLKVSGTFSPDDLGGAKRSLYLEGGAALEITKSLSLSANIGRRTRKNGLDYVSMNLGATKTFVRAFSIDLRYYRTNRSELGEIYDDRLVVAGRWSF